MMVRFKRFLLSLLWDVLLGAMVALSAYPAVALHRKAYAYGASNTWRFDLVSLAIYRHIALVGFVVFCVSMAVRCIVVWKKSTRGESFVRLGIVAVCLGIGSLQLGYQRHPADVWIEAYRDWGRQNVNVHELVAWRDQLEADLPEEWPRGGSVPPSQWPAFVTRLSPAHVYCDDKELRLYWGGNFGGHRGILITPRAGPMPALWPHEQRVPFGEGVYVFRSE